MQLDGGGGMRRTVGHHAIQQAQVVGMLLEIGKKVGDGKAALSAPGELEGRSHERAGLSCTLGSREIGTVVEGLVLARSALHVQKDHALGPGRKHGSLWRQRIGAQRSSRCGEIGQREVAEAAREGLKSWRAIHILTRKTDLGGGKRPLLKMSQATASDAFTNSSDRANS